MNDNRSVAEVLNLTSNLRKRLLESSEEFRLLHALEQVIADMERHGRLDKVNGSDRSGQPASAASAPKGRAVSAPTLRTAAYDVLERAGRPLPINAILQAISQKGVTIRSRNPRAALSSNLSQDARFECRVWDGQPMWGLAKTPPGGTPAA